MDEKPVSPEWLQTFLESQHIEVKRVGEWFMTCCPFHSESRPSFGIHIRDGGYNCFACHESGTFIDLLRYLKVDIDIPMVDIPSSLKYIDAVSKAKGKKPDKNRKKNNLLFRNYKQFDDRHARATGHGMPIFSYAMKRHLGLKVVVDLGIGYIQSQPYLKRLIFPIHDDNGKRILWFEGRAIREKMEPKYWRPSGSPIQNTLYNYHRARNKKFVIVTEGVVDTAILHQWELPSVCCFGSRLYVPQLIKLINFEKVYLCFDGDKAGRLAIREAKKLLGRDEKGSEFAVVPMPHGTDVASMGFRNLFMGCLKKSKII